MELDLNHYVTKIISAFIMAMWYNAASRIINAIFPSSSIYVAIGMAVAALAYFAYDDGKVNEIYGNDNNYLPSVIINSVTKRSK